MVESVWDCGWVTYDPAFLELTKADIQFSCGNHPMGQYLDVLGLQLLPAGLGVWLRKEKVAARTLSGLRVLAFLLLEKSDYFQCYHQVVYLQGRQIFTSNEPLTPNSYLKANRAQAYLTLL